MGTGRTRLGTHTALVGSCEPLRGDSPLGRAWEVGPSPAWCLPAPGRASQGLRPWGDGGSGKSPRLKSPHFHSCTPPRGRPRSFL